MNIKNIYYSLKENIIIVIWFVIGFLVYKKTLDFLGETYSDIKTYSDIIGVLFICLIIFLFIGKIGEKIKNIIKQKRPDLIINYLTLICFFIYFELLNNYGLNYIITSFISLIFIILVLIGLFIYFELLKYKFESLKYLLKYSKIFNILIFEYSYIFIILMFSLLTKVTKKSKEKSFFISDKPIEVQEKEIKDELGFSKKAKSFSKLLYENGSNNNQVFGLVAEWGSGKSSFINLVKSESIIKDNCLVIEFAPWFYETEKELLKKFLDTIISNIKENGFYAPTLSNSFDDLVKLFDKNAEKILGFNIPFFEEKTLETIKTNINDSLKSINKKTIIIIDDLDRVSSNKLKEMFKIINLCKDFYKTNFIVCYDPQNFNSIDENLVKNINQNAGEITSITTQKIDNSELTKYMSKIINVYFPLNIEAEKLKEYFEEIFTDKKYLNFSDASIEGIKSRINKLFEPENYYLRGKYYSNIRGIKRILNNIIAVLNQVNHEAKKDLFHTSFGIKFDIFIKFSILSIYFNHIYTDIKKDVDLTNILWGEYYMKSFKYKLPNNIGILNQVGEKAIEKRSHQYDNYLKELSKEEKELLTNLINSDIRKGHEIDKYIKIIENDYIAILNFIEENVFLENCYNNFLNDIKPVKEILKDIKEKYDFERINKFINKVYGGYLRKEFTDPNKAIEFIDGIIDFDDFYIDVKSIIVFINFNIAGIIESVLSEEIKNFFYGKGNYNISIFEKFINKGEKIGTNYSKIFGLYQALYLIYTFDNKKGNYPKYIEYMLGIKDNYNIVYNIFKEKYYNKNILKIIYDLNLNDFYFIKNIFSPLIEYASQTEKQEINNYLIKCFTDINLFIEFIYRFIKENYEQRNSGNYYFDKTDFLKYFTKDGIINFINDNRETLNNLENKKHIIPNSISGRKNIEVETIWILSEIFKITEIKSTN